MLDELDAHEQPSERMRAEWKSFARLEQPALQQDVRIDDPRLPLEQNGFEQAGILPASRLKQAFSQLGPEYPDLATTDTPIIHHPLLPGPLTPTMNEICCLRLHYDAGASDRSKALTRTQVFLLSPTCYHQPCR
jgi:hypothetical protein